MSSPPPPELSLRSEQRQPPVKPGEELAGKYRVERVIGAGAMGIVVEARHIELDQQVAVKFLYPEFASNAEGAERFRREARAAVRIKNEHVARVLDVGTLLGTRAPYIDIPYIVMEYLQGRDLAAELAERGPFPIREAVRYVLQACEAVSEAHQQGIVHRDLKPANLFLAERGDGTRMIKVLDFGISKVNGLGSKQFSLTDTATLMGSPAYMSPEQLESSRNVDGRADIWSLGVILHELIVGAPPFGGESVPQLVRAILAGRRATLFDRDGESFRLEQVVARCLCQDRAERFQTVGELCEALRPFAEPIESRSSQLPLYDAYGPRTNTSRGLGGVIAPPAPQPSVGSGSGTAWGHTQRSRGLSWRRKSVPALALVVALAGGVRWWLDGDGSDGDREPRVQAGALLPADPSPAGSAAATPSAAAQSPAAPIEPRPEAASERAPGVTPAAPNDVAPPVSAASGGGSTDAPRVHPLPVVSPVRPVAVSSPAPSPPRAPVVLAAPEVARPLPAPETQPAHPARPSPSPVPSPPTASPVSAPEPAPRPVTAEPAAPSPEARDGSSAAPTSEPPKRNGFELPDFGGRE